MQSSGRGNLKNKKNKSGVDVQTAVSEYAKSTEVGLPREFRKAFFADFDKRFVLILLISLVVHIFVVEYLMRNLKKRATPEYFSKLQQKFASLLLEREPLPLPKIEEPQPSEVGLLPLGTPLTTGTPSAGGPMVGPPSSGPLAFGTPEARGSTAEDVATSVRRGAAARAEAMESMESGVGALGVLAILTSGSGAVGDMNMNDVISYAQAQDLGLRESLSSLDALRVSRGPGGTGSGDGTGRGPTGQRVIRGQRQETRALTVTDLVGEVTPLGGAQTTQITREERFEELVSNIEKRPEMPTTPEEKERLRRKPEFVQAVLQRHNLAITDCYKSRSKLQPGLKGKVIIRFAIDADGRVINAEILESTFEEEDIEQCILMRVLRWNDFGYGDPTAPPEIYRQVYTFGY